MVLSRPREAPEISCGFQLELRSSIIYLTDQTVAGHVILPVDKEPEEITDE